MMLHAQNSPGSQLDSTFDPTCPDQASLDGLLVNVCLEILTGLVGEHWALVSGPPGLAAAMTELCIRNFPAAGTAGAAMPECPADRKSWFIIPRRELAALQAAVADLEVLVAPIGRDALCGFLVGPANGTRPDGHTKEHLRVERDEMLQVLIQANLKLQENAQMRNNFLARSVHDFRAPLTAINGYCGLLLEEEFGPLTSEQERVLERMLHSATRLSHISNGMFQLSIPADLAQNASLEQADINECVNQALHEIALVIEDKRITVTTDIEPAPEGLHFEKSQIERTLVNLLDNACRFTPCEGTIGIKGYPYFWERRAGHKAPIDCVGERRRGQVNRFNSFRIDIQDSGPGIPAEHADTVFEEYTSYGGGKDRSGGGLGLAICRMILQRHQGRLWVENGLSGAIFSFVLPLQLPASRAVRRGDSV